MGGGTSKTFAHRESLPSLCLLWVTSRRWIILLISGWGADPCHPGILLVWLRVNNKSLYLFIIWDCVSWQQSGRSKHHRHLRGKEANRNWFVLHMVEVIKDDSGRKTYYFSFWQWWQFNSIWLHQVAYGIRRHWKRRFIKMINKVSFPPWLHGCDQKSKATWIHLGWPQADTKLPGDHLCLPLMDLLQAGQQ